MSLQLKATPGSHGGEVAVTQPRNLSQLALHLPQVSWNSDYVNEASSDCWDIAGGAAPGGYRSSDEDELAELTAQSQTKDIISHIKEGEGYSGSNSSDESETGTTRSINIPGARMRLFEEGEIAYRKTLRLSSEQIVGLYFKV
jgi:hypothetical protein